MSEETRTMQPADTTSARAPEDAPALVKKIGKTTYKVRVHFSDTSTETMSDKIKRMLKNEIYLLTSLAPIPVATLSNRELGNTGQNYLKSLFAVGFQGLLILVCVAIYAVLIQGIATGGDPIGAIWGCMGYSVLLCFCLFKTGSIARSVFSAH